MYDNRAQKMKSNNAVEYLCDYPREINIFPEL